KEPQQTPPILLDRKFAAQLPPIPRKSEPIFTRPFRRRCALLRPRNCWDLGCAIAVSHYFNWCAHTQSPLSLRHSNPPVHSFKRLLVCQMDLVWMIGLRSLLENHRNFSPFPRPSGKQEQLSL